MATGPPPLASPHPGCGPALGASPAPWAAGLREGACLGELTALSAPGCSPATNPLRTTRGSTSPDTPDSPQMPTTSSWGWVLFIWLKRRDHVLEKQEMHQNPEEGQQSSSLELWHIGLASHGVQQHYPVILCLLEYNQERWAQYLRWGGQQSGQGRALHQDLPALPRSVGFSHLQGWVSSILPQMNVHWCGGKSCARSVQWPTTSTFCMVRYQPNFLLVLLIHHSEFPLVRISVLDLAAG